MCNALYKWNRAKLLFVDCMNGKGTDFSSAIQISVHRSGIYFRQSYIIIRCISQKSWSTNVLESTKELAYKYQTFCQTYTVIIAVNSSNGTNFCSLSTVILQCIVQLPYVVLVRHCWTVYFC